MKRVNVFVLAALLGFAPVATAGLVDSDNSVHNSASATGGNASAGAEAGASNSTEVGVNTTSVSGASSKQGQIQGQSSEQGQEQGINAFNGNTTTVEAPDVKGMGKELAKHASSAAEVHSSSAAVVSPCGDSTGLSAQAGLFGGALATVPETCRAARLQALETIDNGSFSTKLAKVTYFVGWLPRTVLHVVTAGVLN